MRREVGVKGIVVYGFGWRVENIVKLWRIKVWRVILLLFIWRYYIWRLIRFVYDRWLCLCIGSGINIGLRVVVLEVSFCENSIKLR